MIVYPRYRSSTDVMALLLAKAEKAEAARLRRKAKSQMKATQALETAAATPKQDTRPIGLQLYHDRLQRGEQPVTLPPVTMSTITDSDIGLKDDPIAQEKAERYLMAVLANQRHQEQKARAAQRLASAQKLIPGPTVHIEIPDESVLLENPTDQLSETDRAIYRELKRLEARPPFRWMQPDGEKASKIS